MRAEKQDCFHIFILNVCKHVRDTQTCEMAVKGYILQLIHLVAVT